MRVAQRRACPTGKQWSYPSLADAQADLVRVQRELRARDSDAKVPERAYPCPVCKFWHLTSSERDRVGKSGRRR